MELNLQELNKSEYPIPVDLQNTVAISSLSTLYNWGRRNSMWPMLFGLACCAIEMIATASSRFDFSRFGMEVMRGTPRQSDLMIVSGTVTKKMVVPIVRLYNQMPEPKYVLAMGACASGGGPFKEGYHVVSGIDKYLPVDVYVPGCPPTPQALMYGLISLQKKIDGQSVLNHDDMPWYGVGPSDPTPVPILGPDIIDPRQMDMIRRLAETAAKQKTQDADQHALPAARSLPGVIKKAVASAAPASPGARSAAPAAAAVAAPEDDKRAAALARKAARAAKEGGGTPNPIPAAPASEVRPSDSPGAASAPVPVVAAAPNVTTAAPEAGGKPWEEADDIREQRRQAALARKAARGSKKD
jgi:NADH-quinone oxidoreductase subunit B